MNKLKGRLFIEAVNVAQGVAAVFLPGTSTEEIVKFLRENVGQRA